MDVKEIISRLERIDNKEYSGGFEFADSSTFNEMCRCYEERKVLAQEIKKLNRIIKIMENYLELIYDLGYDQDGCKTTGDLISLIDELVRFASLGRAYNATSPIFVSGNRKFNILNEELGENDGKENN